MDRLYYVINVLMIIALATGYRQYNYEEDDDLSDLGNLGQRITNRVNAQLAPLNGLGQRISDRVQKQLEHINNGQLQRNIQDNVQKSLSGLDNLGQQISQSVYEGLEPVRALEVKTNMLNGIGGTTIVKHLPSGTTFIVENYKTYKCSGTISLDTGKCQGGLIPHEFSIDDICYSRSYSIVNDKICFSSGGVSVSVVNNVVSCQGSNGNPAVMMTIDEYKKKCGDQSREVKYTYIANPSDPAHVQIPNPNKHVKCENNTPGRCEFTESHWPNIINSGSSITINNAGSYINYNG